MTDEELGLKIIAKAREVYDLHIRFEYGPTYSGNYAALIGMIARTILLTTAMAGALAVQDEMELRFDLRTR